MKHPARHRTGGVFRVKAPLGGTDAYTLIVSGSRASTGFWSRSLLRS